MKKLGLSVIGAVGASLMLGLVGCHDGTTSPADLPAGDASPGQATTTGSATAPGTDNTTAPGTLDSGSPASTVPAGNGLMADLDGGGYPTGIAPVDVSADGGLPDASDPLPPLLDGGASGADGAIVVMPHPPEMVATDGPSVDLLFVIDNTGSMATKQAKLAKQLPRLVDVLISGDRCVGLDPAACTYTETTTPKRTFAAVKSLHLGVVTSNAGGIDNPPMNQVAIATCRGVGDDGKLQNSTDLAVQGVTANRNEFQGFSAGDVVIAPDPSCGNLGSVPLYQEYEYTDSSTDTAIAHNFGCVAHVGVRGCPFEQHLESAWKALAPSGDGDLYRFINGSAGQGDSYNNGFVRDDAVLAVVVLADEDDCAITDAGKVMFLTGGMAGAEADANYGALNLRCGLNYKNADLIQPTARYIDGLKSLKPGNPDRIIFAAITGVPQAAIADNLSYDDILALPEMQFSENSGSPGFPNITCANQAQTEVAYPGIRHVEVARGFGEQGILYSICEDDYAPAVDSLLERLVPKLTP